MGIRLNARGRKRIPGTPIVLSFGARSGVSWSLKAGRLTYSPKARRLSVNTPGIGSVQITPGRKPAARGNTAARRYPPVAELRADADLVAYALERITCRSCGAEVQDVCRTATKRTPTDMHRWRLEDAWDRIAGDRSTPPPSSSVAGALLRRVLGWLAVATLLVLVAPHVNLLPW
jgi:hypothetical protein